MFSRRAFLSHSACSLALVACANGSQDKSFFKIDKVGIQTYTLRDAMRADTAATLAMIASVGYDYVELNGRDFAEMAPDVLAGLVAEAGLYAPSTHLDLASLRDDPARTAKTCQVLGCEYGVLPWIGADERTLDDWKGHAALLNTAGQVFADHGIRLAYHNHQFEFVDLGGGTRAMDILLAETQADLVAFELDIFWARLAGVDFESLFRANPGRFELCHIKDMKGDPAPFADSDDYGNIVQTLMVNVGEGEIDFAAIFALNDISGMKYFITEHDGLPEPHRASIATSYNTVKSLSF